jgi:hypothetical protein
VKNVCMVIALGVFAHHEDCGAPSATTNGAAAPCTRDGDCRAKLCLRGVCSDTSADAGVADARIERDDLSVDAGLADRDTVPSDARNEE